MPQTLLEIEGLRKFTLNGVDLRIEQGEILSLLGVSGSGKSTLLRCVAGVEQPDAGRIVLGGRVLNDARVFVPPEKRGIGLVFQSFALFPHLTVSQNIGFGLQQQSGRQKQERISEQLKRFHLVELAGRYPHQISGGQQQRVALARALAPEPQLLLLDEPFSNLDQAVREALRHELRGLFRELGITALIISHNQHDALSTSDRIAFLHDGAIEQIATPHDAYHHPHSPFVARYLGRANLIPATTTAIGVRTEIGDLEVDHSFGEGKAGTLLIRPEWCELSSPEREISGTISQVEEVAGRPLAWLEISQDFSLQVEVGRRQTVREGDRAGVIVHLPSLCLLPPESSGSI